jgi:hypothetical protein
MSRHLIKLTGRRSRELAKVGIDRAPDGWLLELKEPKRSDEQNRALWGLLNQIQKQRPMHNGVRMSPDLWKATFMQALGVEMLMLPTLEGDGYFPVGHRSSVLTVGEFSQLIELILAWTAREGLTIEHFDGEEMAAA